MTKLEAAICIERYARSRNFKGRHKEEIREAFSMAARMLMHGSSDINYPYASGMEVASVIHQYMMHNKLDDATRAALNSAFVVLTYPQTNVSVAGTGICKTTAVAPLIHRFSFRNEDITWHLCPICSTILKENDHPDENTQNCPRCNVNILWE